MQTALVIDLSSQRQELLSHTCKNLEIQTLASSSLSDTLKVLSSEKLHFIFLETSSLGDKMNAFIRKVRSHPKLSSLPILVYSSRNDKKELASALKEGVDGFIVYPITEEKLTERLERIQAYYAKADKEEKSDEKQKPKENVSPQMSIISKEAKASEIEKRIEKLPSFPTVVMEVLRIVNDVNGSPQDLQEYILKDQTLTAKVLKMANSSFYMQSRQITTIKDALRVLGFNTLKSIVYALSTSDIFSRELPGYGYGKSGLWKHSMLVGMMSQKIAQKAGMSSGESEEAFVAGLLHDIGKLVLYHYFKDVSAEEQKSFASRSIMDVEKQYCGFDHTGVGKKIALSWNLPAVITSVVAFHQEPQKCSEHQKVTNIVHLANYLSCESCYGFERESVFQNTLDEDALKALGFSTDDLEGFTQLIEKCTEEIDSLTVSVA